MTWRSTSLPSRLPTSEAPWTLISSTVMPSGIGGGGAVMFCAMAGTLISASSAPANRAFMSVLSLVEVRAEERQQFGTDAVVHAVAVVAFEHLPLVRHAEAVELLVHPGVVAQQEVLVADLDANRLERLHRGHVLRQQH